MIFGDAKKKEINCLNWVEQAQGCVFWGGKFEVGDE